MKKDKNILSFGRVRGGVGLSVRYKTQLCDAEGNVIRDLQEGTNEITDWGMDAIKTTSPGSLMAYLHLSSTAGPASRIGTGSGATLSLAVTSPTSITVTASAGFFLAGDVGNTLSIDTLQEMKITGYTDSSHVTCSTRQGFWISGSAPGAGPYSNFGVHFTSVNTLDTQTQKFNTYDTTATNYNAVNNSSLNDSANSRFINQHVFLSAVVTGTAWTINQVGWSDGNGSNNVFGKANLATPDVVAVGQRYRLQLQVFEGYTPINISAQVINWGATIGTYTVNIRTENIGGDGSDFLAPQPVGSLGNTTHYQTSVYSLSGTKWRGDAGYPNSRSSDVTTNSTDVTDSAYTAGSHTFNRVWNMKDTYALNAVYGMTLSLNGGGTGLAGRLSLVPTSGTITKPSGYQAILTFAIYWTRQLLN